MPTLKEIKGRIGSVQSTLKITSAMKLVSSAKLRKAQVAIANMRPYEEQLQRILSAVRSGEGKDSFSFAKKKADTSEKEPFPSSGGDRPSATAIIAMASNSSLCGGFNANAIAKVKALLAEYPGATVYSVGRKMADAMRKAGYLSPKDFSDLSEHPAYGPAAELAEKLMEEVEKGHIDKVFLVYNHFVSTAKQVPVVERFLPIMAEDSFPYAKMKADASEKESSDTAKKTATSVISSGVEKSYEDYILEPNAKELLEALVPKTLKLKLYAALLDSAAAEHAARTVAMQTATDNGEDLLDELTLQYNKGRQQKITSEILDLAAGEQK